jgi:hypothetical protein
MHDLAAILSDIASYITAGRRAKSPIGRLAVGVAFIGLIVLAVLLIRG